MNHLNVPTNTKCRKDNAISKSSLSDAEYALHSTSEDQAMRDMHY
jgi:hypothetical protein